MQYVVLSIRLNELSTKQVSVPAWEAPIVQAIYGDAALIVDSENVNRPMPEVKDEYRRLAQKYDRQNEEANSTVARVYGTFEAGFKKLGEAMDEANTDEDASNEKQRKSDRLKVLEDRQKAELKAFQDRQKAEREQTQRDIEQREEDRKRREEDEEQRSEDEAERLADLHARTLARIPTAGGTRNSGSASATRAGSSRAGVAPGTDSAGHPSATTTGGASRPQGGAPAGGAAPGNGPSGTGASPGTKANQSTQSGKPSK